MDDINGKNLSGGTVEVSSAKPRSDKKKKKKKYLLRNQEKRMNQTKTPRGGMMMGMLPTPPRSRSGRIPQPAGPRGYDYDSNHRGGYGDHRGGYGGDTYYDDFYRPPYKEYYDYGHATPPGAYPSCVPPPPERVPRAFRFDQNVAPCVSTMQSIGAMARGSRGIGRGMPNFDGGYQNQGVSERHFQNSRGGMGGSSWGNYFPQQPRGTSGSDVEWYKDSL